MLSEIVSENERTEQQMSAINEFELKILDFIQEKLSCGALDFIMPKLSFLGKAGLIWIAVAIVMIISRKYRRNGIELAAALTGCLLVGNIILKNLVARARPCWINDTVNMLVSIPKDYSFPSGHTMTAFAAAAVITCANKKLGIAAYILAVCLAFSRMYLYVHFPTDILAGAVIGTIIGFAVCFFSKKFFPPKNSINEQ